MPASLPTPDRISAPHRMVAVPPGRNLACWNVVPARHIYADKLRLALRTLSERLGDQDLASRSVGRLI